MSTTAIQERPITADELERIAHRHGRSELVDGRIIEMSPTGAKHGDVEGAAYLLLHTFVRKHQLGKVQCGEVGCKLPNGRVRAPDVLFIRAERIPSSGSPKGFWPFAPDLAVEIVSASETASEVRDEANEWIAAGSRAVWIVDPATRTVTVFQLAQVPRILATGESLEGGDVLPGFACTVAEIFS
ncbi:MAG: Uma2 family endonuclease [Candidatus Schekmanbacteria bacterium]|nr:Uma2 family endonuclease [Candidatus Schekmanbacteria bacterium]